MKNYEGKKVDLVEAMRSAGVDLTRRGKRLWGLCPFHNDRHPSLVLSEDQGAWYCHVCAFGGNAIEFVKRLHGTDFKGALKILGVDSKERPPPDPKVQESRLAHAWAKKASHRIRDILRQIGDEKSTEWIMLAEIDEDLNAKKFVEQKETRGTWTDDPERVLEMWRDRKWVESILDKASTK